MEEGRAGEGTTMSLLESRVGLEGQVCGGSGGGGLCVEVLEGQVCGGNGG